jgi:hypothetical protein
MEGGGGVGGLQSRVNSTADMGWGGGGLGTEMSTLQKNVTKKHPLFSF